MQAVRSITQWRSIRKSLPSQTQRIGLVPTMGYLHEGHLSLVRAARKRDDLIIVTIYVNPTQFIPGEDFEQYPRDEARDLALLEKEGVDYVFIPSTEDIYPEGFSTYVQPPAASEGWCGESRPGHFRGVCTIIPILYNLVQPHRAYFGRKDAQQCAVIKSITRDLGFPVEIQVCPTVREQDGLAMSSRNIYLSPEDRGKALILSKTLRQGVELFRAGVANSQGILSKCKEQICRIEGVRLDYLGIVDQNTFKPVDTIQPDNYIIGAIFVGKTRLIDNLVFQAGEYTPCNESC